MSDSADTDQDLRDVFKLLYEEDEEDWAFDEDEHPPLDALIPELEVDQVENTLSPPSEDDYQTDTYSRKRFRTQLDSLIFPSSKKRRIYNPPQTSREYILSTSPLPLLPPASSFEPFEPLALLARLRTFHPSTYSPFHPLSISPTRLAMGGWYCSSKEGVECGSCGAAWGVAGLEEIRDGRVREEIARRLGEGMGMRHKDGCPWRVLTCPNNLVDRLRNSLHPPLANNIASLAQSLSSLNLNNLNLKSRLTEKQSYHLSAALNRFTSTNPISGELAFFGWSPHPLSSEIISCRLCQRRVGLWAFQNESTGLDPVREHLGWCPLGSESWWNSSALLQGKRGNVGDVTVSKGVKRRKWLVVKTA